MVLELKKLAFRSIKAYREEGRIYVRMNGEFAIDAWTMQKIQKYIQNLMLVGMASSGKQNSNQLICSSA